MEKPLWAWIVFFTLVIFLLVFDLGMTGKKRKELSVKDSMILSGIYFTIGTSYAFVIYAFDGNSQQVFEYLTSFIVEKSLSMDNLFIMSIIFTHFAIPKNSQHRILFWGILGVIVLRGGMIGLGSAAIIKFSWILWIFGGILIFTGVKILYARVEASALNESSIFRVLQKYLPLTSTIKGKDFWIKEGGKWKATPLFAALTMIECTDIVFAVDSVPAVFAITLDPYIVYTSNIFAILGLRALSGALFPILHRFEYIKHALALVLIFIGGKIFYAAFIGHVPASFSLVMTLSILGGGVVYSLWKTKKKALS